MQMKTLMAAVVVAMSVSAFAGDKGVVPLSDKAGARPGRGAVGPQDDGPPPPEAREHMERSGRMMAVVAIADALELNEAEALKVGDKLKGFDERRRPIHEAMGEAMRSIRAAADGDAAAAAAVDQNMQKILDGRTQMAALDKELYNALASGLSPQKRAKLALALGQLHQMRGGMGGGRGGGFGRGPGGGGHGGF